MTVQFQLEDYVLVEQEGKKHLVQVDKTTGKTGRGIKQEKFPYEENELKFEADEVVANYGKYPKPFIHEAFYKHFDHEKIGRIYFFMKATKEIKKELEDTLNTCYKKLEKYGLTGFFPVRVEVRPPKGKMLGYYKPVKGEGDLDILGLRPSTESPLDYVFYHEAGHGVWKRLIHKRKAKAAWIRDYNQFIEVQHLTSKDLKSMLNDLLSSGQPLHEFKSGLSDNDQLILKEIVSYIKKYHRLTPLDLSLLLDSEDHDTLTDVWPTDTIALSKIKLNAISTYSLKSVEEYFSECLALYLTKGKLPSRTEKLMQKTLSSL